jgi:hypothetical protein
MILSTPATAQPRLRLHGAVMISFGAIPATCLAFFAMGLPGFWSHLTGILAISGTIGLWIAAFQDPHVSARGRLLTICLLLLGMFALGRITAAILIGLLMRPSFRATWAEVLLLWLFAGPAFCAVAFIVAQIIARIRCVASNKSLERTRGE